MDLSCRARRLRGGACALAAVGPSGARAFIAAWALVVVALFFAPPLSQLEPSRNRAGARAVVARAAGVDRIDGLPASSRPEQHADVDNAHTVSRDFAACALAALAVTLTHALSAAAVGVPLGLAERALGALRSLLLHLVVFSGIFAAICVIRGLSRLISPRAAVEAWLARGVLAIALRALPLARRAPAARARRGARGDRGRCVRRGAGGGVRPARDQAPAGPRPGVERPRSAVGDAIGRRRDRLARDGRHRGLAGRTAGGASDWNFVVAKSAALASWLIALAAALRMPTDGRHAPESSRLRCASSFWA